MWNENNILKKRWNERYNNLDDEIKMKLELDGDGGQLKVLKKSRKYPEVGDVFKLVSNDNIEIDGIVINNHVNNINGEDLIVIALLKYEYDYKHIKDEGFLLKNLSLPFQIVGKEYWTKGYFDTYDHIESNYTGDSYGFYSVGKGKFFDEYGKELINEPKILGVFGVSTIIGISTKLHQEFIINRII